METSHKVVAELISVENGSPCNLYRFAESPEHGDLIARIFLQRYPTDDKFIMNRVVILDKNKVEIVKYYP